MINFTTLENWIGEPLSNQQKIELDKTYRRMVQATKLLKHGNPLSVDEFFGLCIIFGHQNLKRMKIARLVETVLDYKAIQMAELKPIEVTV